MFEWFTLSFAYTVGKDLLAKIRGRQRRLTPSQIVELRQKWKPEFEKRVGHTHREGLREDVIIRDMKRLDAYPDHLAGHGISPWFRLFLVGTYHRGILVAHSWGTLTKHRNDWRFTNYEAGEEGDVKVSMISSIRYESIENVDWPGDENYDYPHIYCFFDRKKQPYEKTAFYTETKPSSGNPPFYTEIADYDEVRKRSRKLGIKHFG
jgi:hypothetical protein